MAELRLPMPMPEMLQLYKDLATLDSTGSIADSGSGRLGLPGLPALSVGSRKPQTRQNRESGRKEVLSRYQGDWSSVSHLRGAVRLFASKMGTSPTMIVMLLLPDLIIAEIRNVLEIGCEPGPDAGKPAVCVMILAQISHFFADNHAHMIAFQ